MTAEQARMIRSLRSTRITGLHRYYEAVRLRAPHRYSRPRGFNHLGNSLPRPAAGDLRHWPAAARDDRFPRSMQEPEPGSRHLHAGRHLGSKQVSPRPIPGQDPKPGFAIVSELSTRHRWIACARLPGSHLTRSQARLFPRRSARTALNRRTSGWFGASPCRATPEGQTSISCTAPQPTSRGIHLDSPSAFVAHGSPTPLSDAAAPAATSARTGSGQRDRRTTRASGPPPTTARAPNLPSRTLQTAADEFANPTGCSLSFLFWV